MLRRARITRVIAICAMVTIFLSALFIVGFPCLQMRMKSGTNQTGSDKVLPIQTSYLHDVNKSPQFELTFLAQIYGIFVGALSYTGVDNLMGLLVLHVCGQLENLHYRLIYIGKCSNFNAILKYIVEDHIRLIRYSRQTVKVDWLIRN